MDSAGVLTSSDPPALASGTGVHLDARAGLMTSDGLGGWQWVDIPWHSIFKFNVNLFTAVYL